MAKFIMTIGNESFNVLVDEARQRDVTIQQFLRAVVVPDWIRENLLGQNTKHGPESSPHHRLPTVHENGIEHSSDMLVSPAARLRQ